MLVRKKIKLETEAFPTAASLSTTADSLGIVNPLMRKPLSDSGQGMGKVWIGMGRYGQVWAGMGRYGQV